MKKPLVILLVFFVSTATFAQKKKDLIKQLATLKTEKAEMQKKLNSLQKAQEVDLDNELHQFSYAMGVSIGHDLKDAGADSLSYTAFAAGIEDVMLRQEKMSKAAASKQLKETLVRLEDAKNERLQKEGADYLAENATRSEINTTASGLQYEVLNKGDGVTPKMGNRVKVHYRGTLIDGTEFDSSYSRGEPYVTGLDQVIKGWTEALQLMPVGSKWKLYIPYDLAYGERGAGNGLIPPFATMIFDIELLAIEQ